MHISLLIFIQHYINLFISLVNFLFHLLSFYISDKWYETIEEELQRKDMFHQNVKRINMHNSLYDHGIKSFKLGVNEYTDMVCEIHFAINYFLLPNQFIYQPVCS